MPDEPFALSTVPPALPAQGDYDAICATVMESARGRWFLQEYARRNRNADTRLVLDAIERIEAVIRGERGREAYQSFRGELLDMAKAIAQTRAEVAEFHPEAGRGQVAEPAPPAPDVFAAAERIQEVAWTMRERGLDPSTCDQIDALAASILAASALRDPNDQRAHKLGEVLQHLERRINAMLDSCAESTPAATQGDDAAAGHSPPTGHEHDAGIHAAASGIAEAAKSQSAGAPADQGTEHAAVEPEVATPPAETHVQALADAPPELADAKVEAETTTMPVGAGAEQQSAESAAPHGFETEPVDFVGPKRDLTPVPSAVDETAELAPPPLEPQASVPIAEAPAAEVATVAPALPTRITPLPTPPPQGGREQTELAACADSTSPEHAVMADLAEPLAEVRHYGVFRRSGISASGQLGLLPPPLWGRGGEGGDACWQRWRYGRDLRGRGFCDWHARLRLKRWRGKFRRLVDRGGHGGEVTLRPDEIDRLGFESVRGGTFRRLLLCAGAHRHRGGLGLDLRIGEFRRSIS